jgi:hypothetical protein
MAVDPTIARMLNHFLALPLDLVLARFALGSRGPTCPRTPVSSMLSLSKNSERGEVPHIARSPPSVNRCLVRGLVDSS